MVSIIVTGFMTERTIVGAAGQPSNAAVLSAAAQSSLTDVWVAGRRASKSAFHVCKYIPDA